MIKKINIFIILFIFIFFIGCSNNDVHSLSSINGVWFPYDSINPLPLRAAFKLNNGFLEYINNQVELPYLPLAKGTYTISNTKITFIISHYNIKNYVSDVDEIHIGDLIIDIGKYRMKINSLESRYYSKDELKALGFGDDFLEDYLTFGILEIVEYELDGDILKLYYDDYGMFIFNRI